MKSVITIKKQEVKRIESDNFVTSLDIKNAFGLRGNIISIELFQGISPWQEEQQGKSHNCDKWIIRTIEMVEQ